MGLEGAEKIEIICAELAAEVFDADFAEIRIGSGALANLYAFMATAKPGDTILVPPSSIGGHVTHHLGGGCGPLWVAVGCRCRLMRQSFTVDLEGACELGAKERPKLITIGGSLNLFPHPVRDIREHCAICWCEVALRCGAYVRDDCGSAPGNSRW